MQVTPGIHQIRLPFGPNPTRHVNAYLIKDARGCTLVDCGWGTPEGIQALLEALHSLGLQPRDIHTLVCTHGHADHYGHAGTLKKLASPRLLMHRLEWPYLQTELSSPAARKRELERMERHGLSAESLVAGEEYFKEHATWFTMVPPDVELEDGDHVEAGPYDFQVIWSPGHTQGHICLHDPKHRVFLAGDHVLASLSPNLASFLPQVDDPLGAYIASLRRLESLEVEIALPSHGKPFSGFRTRVGEMLAHHAHRQEMALAALAGGPATATQVAERLSWSRDGLTFAQLSPLVQRLALSGTLAHLTHLSMEGRVSSSEREGRIYFEQSTASPAQDAAALAH